MSASESNQQKRMNLDGASIDPVESKVCLLQGWRWRPAGCFGFGRKGVEEHGVRLITTRGDAGCA
jgi:hypothetical protein